MNVTIIGAGNMGLGIGTRLAAAGHSITYLDHHTENSQVAVEQVRKSAAKGADVVASGLEYQNLGDVVILALWYGTNIEVARQLGERLAGRVVVDIANPVNSSYSGLVTPADSSSAEELAQAVDPGARVVKAFNTIYAGTLLQGEVDGQPLDVFIAGDDEAAKKTVSQLVKDAGMRPVDAGPLERARALEAMQLVHVGVQNTLGTNWGNAIKILP